MTGPITVCRRRGGQLPFTSSDIQHTRRLNTQSGRGRETLWVTSSGLATYHSGYINHEHLVNADNNSGGVRLTRAGGHLVDEVLGPGPEVITAAVVAPAPHAAAPVRPRSLGAPLRRYLRLVHDHGRRRRDHRDGLIRHSSLWWSTQLQTLSWWPLNGLGGQI